MIVKYTTNRIVKYKMKFNQPFEMAMYKNEKNTQSKKLFSTDK